MIVITTGFIPLSRLSIVSLMWEKQPVAWKEYCAGEKKLQESMDRCISCQDIIEIMLKMASNAIQSINHKVNPLPQNPDF